MDGLVHAGMGSDLLALCGTIYGCNGYDQVVLSYNFHQVTCLKCLAKRHSLLKQKGTIMLSADFVMQIIRGERKVYLSLFLGSQELEQRPCSLSEANELLQKKLTPEFSWRLTPSQFTDDNGIPFPDRDLIAAQIYNLIKNTNP